MADPTSTAVVVDDAVEVRLLVKHQLGLSGRFAVVGEGGTGREAVDLVARLRPDLLLLDVSMPDMDGLEALPHVRRASPDTVVVLYTGFEQGGLAQQALALGAAALIEKSADVGRLPDELAQIVQMSRSAPLPVIAPDAVPPDNGGPAPENVLDEHLERFREIFEEAAIGMATMTLTGNIVRPNRALAELVVRDLASMVGMSYSSLALDAGDVARHLESCQRGDVRVARFEHLVDTPSGRRRLLATAAPVKDARGRPLYLTLQVQDVTAERAAEEQLRQSEERFRLLVEAVQDYAIFMLDPTGHVMSWNLGAQRIKGYRADEIIGRHFRTFYPRGMQEIGHPENELVLALRDGHYEEEGWRIRKDGSRFWASVLITAVRNGEGVHIGFTKVTRDIDERRQMMLDLEEAANALATANANLGAANTQLAQEAADQAQFLAVTAHELRSPVTVLSGSATLLADHWTEMTEQERGELFESIRGGAGRLQRLLNDLLTASRLESKRIRPVLQDVDLATVLSTSIAASRASQPDVEIRLDCPPGVRVAGEADRVGQAIDNLLANAIRHGRPPVQVSVVPVSDRVEVHVADAGSGVDPAVRDRLFQRFATGGRRGGTGLGLFIVRELARAYGGDAWYDSSAGGSGRFVFSVPVAGVATTTATEASRSAVTP